MSVVSRRQPWFIACDEEFFDDAWGDLPLPIDNKVKKVSNAILMKFFCFSFIIKICLCNT